MNLDTSANLEQHISTNHTQLFNLEKSYLKQSLDKILKSCHCDLKKSKIENLIKIYQNKVQNHFLTTDYHPSIQNHARQSFEMVKSENEYLQYLISIINDEVAQPSPINI